MKQLEQLNAMERQQDVNLWTANSIYVAASSLILVALFTATAPDLIPLKWFLPIVGFAITSAWLVNSTRAHQLEHRWLLRARRLEEAMAIDAAYRVWEQGSPSGIRAEHAEYALLYFFATLWISLGFAVSGLYVATVLSIILVALTIGLWGQLAEVFTKKTPSSAAKPERLPSSDKGRSIRWPKLQTILDLVSIVSFSVSVYWAFIFLTTPSEIVLAGRTGAITIQGVPISFLVLGLVGMYATNLARNVGNIGRTLGIRVRKA
jgi:hypothetical protein